MNLRSRRTVLLAMGAIAVSLFAFGMLAAFLSRHETICPDHKSPVAQRSYLLGQTEYRCHDGKVVTKQMRDWWLRTLLVLQRPRPVFVALRDESPESRSDRAEPILALVILAGIAGALASRSAGHVLDDNSGIVVVPWVLFAGLVSGTVAYFALGALLHWGARLLGSHGSYRRNRQVLAFAAAPIALSLVVWPVRLALYGGDVFRSGGRDTATGTHVFVGLELAFAAWALALLVLGVRAVHGWTLARAAAACAPALAVAAAVVVLTSL